MDPLIVLSFYLILTLEAIITFIDCLHPGSGRPGFPKVVLSKINSCPDPMETPGVATSSVAGTSNVSPEWKNIYCY